MMRRLPNGHRAIVDIRKLNSYCLDPAHPRGRHKARVFREALGIGSDDTSWLREILLAAAHQGDADEMAGDTFGGRWKIDVPVARQVRRAVIRSLWMVRADEDFPRFISCWVL